MKNIRYFAVVTAFVLLGSWLSGQSTAAPDAQPSSVLFHNVRVFDGVKETVSGPADVLVQGNKIEKISTTPIHPDADEATVKLMAAKGIWRSLQPFLMNEDANEQAGAAAQAKQPEVGQGTENAYQLAKKYHIKTAWGTEIQLRPCGKARYRLT